MGAILRPAWKHAKARLMAARSRFAAAFRR
jgi:hypothetical protein